MHQSRQRVSREVDLERRNPLSRVVLGHPETTEYARRLFDDPWTIELNVKWNSTPDGVFRMELPRSFPISGIRVRRMVSKKYFPFRYPSVYRPIPSVELTERYSPLRTLLENIANASNGITISFNDTHTIIWAFTNATAVPNSPFWNKMGIADSDKSTGTTDYPAGTIKTVSHYDYREGDRSFALVSNDLNELHATSIFTWTFPEILFGCLDYTASDSTSFFQVRHEKLRNTLDFRLFDLDYNRFMTKADLADVDSNFLLQVELYLSANPSNAIPPPTQ